MDAYHQATVTRIHNLAVVRKAPPIMACRLSNGSPMTAGALRVLGVAMPTNLTDVIENLHNAVRILQNLPQRTDDPDLSAVYYTNVMELCADVIEQAEVIRGNTRKRLRDLQREPRTERQMLNLIVTALEPAPMKTKPTLQTIEAGGEKAKTLRLADGRCELCHAEWNLTYHHILPRAEGGLNCQENYIVLCKSCHDEIEDKGYRSREAIKRHVRSDAVPLPELEPNSAAERKVNKAQAERQETAQVTKWAERFGDGFWPHVPVIHLGELPPSNPEWHLWVYGGTRRHR
jgi:hypothetical protein